MRLPASAHEMQRVVEIGSYKLRTGSGAGFHDLAS